MLFLNKIYLLTFVLLLYFEGGCQSSDDLDNTVLLNSPETLTEEDETSDGLVNTEPIIKTNGDVETIPINVPSNLRSDSPSGMYIDDSGFNQNDLDGIYGKILF